MNRCEDYPCCGHTDGMGCNYVPDMTFITAHAGCEHEQGYCEMDDEGEEEYCCENYLIHSGDLDARDHDHDCDNYDGAPIYQWEVTEPRDVYYTGTGEDVGDDSYIDYLNRF